MAAAFSTYSALPVRLTQWKDEDFYYAPVFFPWVGAVIGATVFLWQLICKKLGIGVICDVCVTVVLPVILTGGIHLDGFMDTSDALSSFADREKRLKILSDPHIGAFSVIRLAVLGCLYFGIWSQLYCSEIIAPCCGVYFFSRILCVLSIYYFPKAKEGGMLGGFFKPDKKRAVTAACVIEGILCISFWLILKPAAALLCVFTGCMMMIIYKRMSVKCFGGITGDTSGFFLSVTELVMLAALMLSQCLF